MLAENVRANVARRVKDISDTYKATKFQALALPTFDSQGDFEGCRPEDKGRDFREHNEFTAEVLKGLLQNAVPAQPVLFHHIDFLKWLDGRPINQDSRGDYAAHLLAEERKRVRQRQ